VLEHADREDRIERFVQFAVVLQADLDRQAGAQFRANSACSCEMVTPTPLTP
jgi:hypothetical protein